MCRPIFKGILTKSESKFAPCIPRGDTHPKRIYHLYIHIVLYAKILECSRFSLIRSWISGVGPDSNLCRVHGYNTSRRSSIAYREDSSPSDGLRYIGPPAMAISSTMHTSKCTADLHRSCFCVRFIAEHTRIKEESLRVYWLCVCAVRRLLLYAKAAICICITVLYAVVYLFYMCVRG